jgi:hypothetical protein
VHVEIEQWSGFSTRFINNKVIKRVVLESEESTCKPRCPRRIRTWGMMRSSCSAARVSVHGWMYKKERENLNIHEVVDADTSKLGELLSAFL